MKITLATLLEGVEYTPVPGIEYEIAEGVWGVMRPPTADLVAKVEAVIAEDGYSDIQGAKIVLKGLKPVAEGALIPGMASLVMRDFFTMYEMIATRLNALLAQYAPSEAAEGQA